MANRSKIVSSDIKTVFVGDYKHSAQTTNHNGWLLCHGQEISRTTYSELFTIINTNFGNGNGSTTFNLPDFRGRIIGITGQGNGLTNRNLGDKIGEENHQLTIAELPSHNHIQNREGSTSGGNINIRLGTLSTTSSGETNTNLSTQNTGQNLAHNNMQPTLFGGNVFIFGGVV